MRRTERVKVMRDHRRGGARLQPDLEYRETLMGHVEGLGGTAHAQEAPCQNRPLRRKPSPTVWRLVLLIGDGIVLMALLVQIMNPAPQLGLNMQGGMWNASLLWLFLTLASWGLAVNITQAQQLNCASSLLKSPLYALCSLLLMLIFCMLLLYLFLGNGVMSYLKPLLLFLVIAAPILGIWRVFLAEVIHLPRFRRQAVIVGANAAGEGTARELQRAKHPGVRVLGYIDESGGGQEQQDGLPVFSGRSALRSLAQNGVIDTIIMAIDFKANPELFQEALAVAQRGISVVP